MILIIQKINSKFMQATKTKQPTGLSVCLNMIQSQIDGTKIINVVDHNEVYAAIKGFDPKIVIFEAMSFSYLTLTECARLFPRTHIYAHIHSKFPFLGMEQDPITYIRRLLDYKVGVIFNHESAMDMFPKESNVKYLPNIYYAKDIPDPKHEEKFSYGKRELHVGCHGSMRHMKNHVVQAAAAARYASAFDRELHLHINTSRNDGELQHILGNVEKIVQMYGGKVVRNEWMEHDDFLKYVSKLDLGLQLSLCETFNIVSADYVHAGIPVVVSPEINWLPNACVSNPTDIIEIMGTMNRVLGRNDLITTNRQCLFNYSHFAKTQWEKFIADHY